MGGLGSGECEVPVGGVARLVPSLCLAKVTQGDHRVTAHVVMVHWGGASASPTCRTAGHERLATERSCRSAQYRKRSRNLQAGVNENEARAEFAGQVPPFCYDAAILRASYARYWSASASRSAVMRSSPARSAIVRATRSAR